MKTMIFLLTAVVFTGAVMAQQDPADPGKKDPVEKTSDQNYVTMENGKVWMYESGKKTEVTREQQLGAIKVKPDGVVTLKNGNIYALRNGDKVFENGTVHQGDEKGSPGKSDNEPGQKQNDSND